MLSTCKGNVLISRCKQTNKHTNKQRRPKIQKCYRPELSHGESLKSHVEKHDFALRHNSQGQSQFHESTAVVAQLTTDTAQFVARKLTIILVAPRTCHSQDAQCWTLSTTWFNNKLSTLGPHWSRALKAVVCFSQRTAVISLKSRSRLGFVVER